MTINREERIDTPVHYVQLGKYCKVDLYSNERIEEHEVTSESSESSESSETIVKTFYVYDFNRFSFNVDKVEFTIDDIIANPSKFNKIDGDITFQRNTALKAIQDWNDNETNKKAVLATTLGFDVEYSPKALTMIQGIVLMMNNGMMIETTWTDADDLLHEHLDFESVKTICAIFAGHLMEIQAKADSARDKVKKSLNTENIKEIARSFR